MSLYGKLLIIDNNFRFLDTISQEKVLSEEFPFISKRTWGEGLRILDKEKDLIRSIFISGAILNQELIEEIRNVKASRPVPNLFLVTHNPETLSEEIRNSGLFTETITRPRSYSDLTSKFQKLTLVDGSWEGLSPTTDKKLEEVTRDDKDFIAMGIGDYVFTVKSYFNLYLKRAPGRYMKIINAGDPVDDKTLVSHFEQGEEFLYIHQAEHDKYLYFCQELSAVSLKREHPSKSVGTFLKFGASIAQSLQQTGISLTKLDTANQLLSQSMILIRNLKTKDAKFLDFISTIENKDHVSFVAFIATLLGKEVGFESNKMVRLVGVAALVHDIGLYALDPSIENEEQAALTPEKQEVFNMHAAHGAKILRESGVIEEAICLAVECHHSRRKGASQSTHLNLLSEVIAVADEIHQVLLREKFNKSGLITFINSDLKRYSSTIEQGVKRLFKC